jgi:hypothetical protein
VNLRDIAEVAGLISLHSGHLIERAGGFTPAQLHDHLRLSRRGVQLWLAAASPAAEDQDRPIGVQHDVARLVEEVLVAEILTRITAAVLTAADDRQPGKPTAPFAKHIIRGQLEARRAVLERATQVPLPLGQLLSLDRLRRRTERWTDLLLGPFVSRSGVSDLAFDAARALEFGERAAATAAEGRLQIVALRQSVPALTITDPERANVQQALLRSVLSWLPPAAFGTDGLLKSEFQRRIEQDHLGGERPFVRDRNVAKDAAERGSATSGATGVSFLRVQRRIRPRDAH